MLYIIIAIILVLATIYLGRQAYLEHQEELEQKSKKESIAEASEELDSVNLSQQTMDVKEKVVESKNSLQARDRNLQQTEVNVDEVGATEEK